MSKQSGFQVDEQGPEYYEKCAKYFMEPFVDALVAAGVRTGETVLDVACGTGFAARAASKNVGPTGRVVGSDINPNMLTMARSLGSAVHWQPVDST